MFATTLIEIPQWGNVTLIELIWLMTGVIAMLFTGIHIKPLWTDYNTSRLTKNRILIVMARDYFRREILRCLEGSLITGLGCYVCALKPVAPGPAYISIVGLIVTIVFLLIGTFVSIQSNWDWYSRKEIQHLLTLPRTEIKQALQ